jgi:outer membrane protein assembly factor BamB
MRISKSALRTAVACAVMGMSGGVFVVAADWPQWRGPNRDGKVTDFKVPQTWPKELKQQWMQSVGGGDSTPALVGDRLYVFARQGTDEVTQCLDATNGKPIWEDKYSTITVTGPAGGEHAGPRSSPAVADGKVVTFGVGGVLSCLDANTGKVIWRKDSAKEFSPAWPAFYTAMSPLIVDGLCVAHLGGSAMGGMGGGGGRRGGGGGGAGAGGGAGGPPPAAAPGGGPGGPPPAAAAGAPASGPKGAVIAFDLNTGDAKWKWEGEPPAYSSPVVANLGGVKQVIEVGDQLIVGLAVADGKLLWKTPVRAAGGPGGPGGGPGGPGGGPPGGGPGGGPPGGGPGGGGPGGGGGRGRGGGGGMSNNAATPLVEGDTIVYAGQGVRALKIEKQGDTFEAKEQWSNPEFTTAFSTPVLKDGKIYGLAGNNTLYCLDAADGKKVWAKDLQAGGGGGGGGAPPGAGAGGPGGGGGRRGGGGGMGRGGFGSIVDAGSVLIALSPSSELVVLKPGEKEYSEVARIKVANSPTYAYPVLAGNRIIIRDQDAVTAYTIE